MHTSIMSYLAVLASLIHSHAEFLFCFIFNLCHQLPIATFDVTSKYVPNKPLEAKKCYGTTSIEHPAVLMITNERKQFYCGGKITGKLLMCTQVCCLHIWPKRRCALAMKSI